MPAEPGSAIASVMIENERVRVTEWRFKQRGDSTGWHRHAYDYIVVPNFDGTLDIDLGDGQKTTSQLRSGVPYFRQRGVEHNVINANDFECAFVEIELLESPS